MHVVCRQFASINLQDHEIVQCTQKLKVLNQTVAYVQLFQDLKTLGV